MKKIILIWLVAILVGGISICCTNKDDRCEKQSQEKLIVEAQDAFIRDFHLAVDTRSIADNEHKHKHYSLADTDFTPLWESSFISEDNDNVYIDVPVLAMTLCFSSIDGGTTMLPMAQKLLFIKNKQTNIIESNLLTLSFDEECQNRYGCTSSIFRYNGDISNFSGLAILTNLEGRFISITKYVNGVVQSIIRSSNKSDLACCVGENFALYLTASNGTRAYGNWVYESVCDDCGLYPCMCFGIGLGEWICEKCGSYHCMCESGGDGAGYDSQVGSKCEYCGAVCNNSCSAYCPTCHNLKSQCQNHYCSRCGMINAQCICNK